MKVKFLKKPRLFNIGNVTLKDCGKILLNNDEIVTFQTTSKKKYDFTSKEWGFYITSSINSRLKKEGFKIALVKNKKGKIYLMAVEKEKKKNFNIYCVEQKLKILNWL
tara:strand:+ start:627 stop:950 length:324 start_codon:yes stop_codon:yes gene_type:complete